MGGKSAVTKSSGNVFTDLDVEEPGQALAKAELARKISSIIRARHLGQANAAEVLGIDQPKVSALMRGLLAGFSTDRLFRFLNTLGRDVDILIRRRSSGSPSVRVFESSDVIGRLEGDIGHVVTSSAGTPSGHQERTVSGKETKMAKPRDTYKYQFKVGNKIVHGGITIDLDRREQEHRQKWPNGHIKQVGRRTNEEAARQWEKDKGYS